MAQAKARALRGLATASAPPPRHLLRGNATPAAQGQPQPGGGRSGNTGKVKSAAGLPRAGPHSHSRASGPPRCCRATEGPAAPRPPKGERKRAEASRLGAGVTGEPRARRYWARRASAEREQESRAAAVAAHLRGTQSGCAGPGPPPRGCGWEGSGWISKCSQPGFPQKAFSSGLSLCIQRGGVLASLGKWRYPVPGTPYARRLVAVHRRPAEAQPGRALSSDERWLRKNQHNSHAEHKLPASLRGPAELMEDMCTEDSMCSHREFQQAAERKLCKPRWAAGYKPRSVWGIPWLRHLARSVCAATATGGVVARTFTGDRHRYPESL